jgi:transposase
LAERWELRVVLASGSSAGGLKTALSTVAVWLLSEVAARRVLAAAWLEQGASKRIAEAVLATGTTVTDIHGIGPLGAAIILGHTGDIARFPTKGHYARYNCSAPIVASSGPRQRHRLNPRGDRQLNRALHVAAVTQVRNDTQGRAVPCQGSLHRFELSLADRSSDGETVEEVP